MWHIALTSISNIGHTEFIHNQKNHDLKLDFLHHSTLGVLTLECVDQLDLWQHWTLTVRTLECLDQLCLNRSNVHSSTKTEFYSQGSCDIATQIYNNYFDVIQINWWFNLFFANRNRKDWVGPRVSFEGIFFLRKASKQSQRCIGVLTSKL